MSPLPKNKFYDINKLPTTEGILLLGVSMSRIGNGQSPKKCFEYLTHLASKIQHTDGIGMVILYADYLYFHSEDPAHKLRDRFTELMISHKNAFMNLLKKDRQWTHKAFSFKTFGQILLENSGEYPQAFKSVQDLYKNDPLFKKYVDQDCSSAGRGTGVQAVNFILEEITIFYLSQKGLFSLYNPFVNDAEKSWTLQAYPGKPLLSEVYLFQNNPLNIHNPKNIYENCYYDLEDKIIYDYSRIDIDKMK